MAASYHRPARTEAPAAADVNKGTAHDLGFFPACNAAPVYYGETLEQFPELQEVFDAITPTLTDEALRVLNLRVDVEGEEPADVAFDFMVDNGFISRP